MSILVDLLQHLLNNEDQYGLTMRCLPNILPNVYSTIYLCSQHHSEIYSILTREITTLFSVPVIKSEEDCTVCRIGK